MARIRTKVGDVFSVPLDTSTKKYFQYIANDLTQLNSDVIRAFAKTYPLTATPDLLEVVKDTVDFHAHVVVKWGIQMNLWEKAGFAPYHGTTDVLFRDSKDYGNPQIRISHDWRVWRINEEFQDIGKLDGDYVKAEIGIVVAPPGIVERMRNGTYRFVYPGY